MRRITNNKADGSFIVFSLMLCVLMLKTVNAMGLMHKMTAANSSWPMPYERLHERPPNNPYCKALIPFCPAQSPIPTIAPNDRVEVLLLKAPVWKVKFGNLLGQFDIFHDAIGFRNLNTGLNYTSEWYELDQLLNCTFPHILSNRSTPLWCNQGASCWYKGIDDNHWKSNGTMVKVTELSGIQFNQWANWTRRDNITGNFYFPWTVLNSENKTQKWFESYDCANFVIRAFEAMHNLGAVFVESYVPRYTQIQLFSKMPVGLDYGSPVMKNITKFFSNFQAHQSFFSMLKSLFNVFKSVAVWDQFYVLFNQKYWELPLQWPFLKLEYIEVPLPGTKAYMAQKSGINN